MTALRVPGGNQVDGLPPARHTKTVAKRRSREPRTQMHLTMKITFVKVISSSGNLRMKFKLGIEASTGAS